MNTFAHRTMGFRSRRRALGTRPAGAQPLEPLEPRRLLATFAVDTFVDSVTPGDGLTSLREAVNAAIATPEDDQIDIPAGNYVLELGQIEIHDAEGAMTLSGIDGTAVIDADGASRVFSIDASEVAMDNLRITGGNASDGGGILSLLSSLTISDSHIVGNSAERDGGGIHTETSWLVLDTVEVEENTAGRNGGGVSGVFVDVFQVVGSEVNFNSALDDGGGMHLSRVDGAIADSRFSGNAAGRDGGGLALLTSFITGSELTVQNNTAVRDGGGAFLRPLSRLDVSGSSAFAFNNAARDGGGVFAGTFSNFLLNDGGVTQNRAGRAGGGIGLASSSRARISGGAQISSNTAVVGGGVGSVSSVASVEIAGGTFLDANLALLGGGTYGVNVDATNSSISNNIARFEGGGIHRDGGGNSSIRLNGVFMHRNEAQNGRGGGIFADLTVRMDIEGSDIVFNTASREGGGIFAGGFDALTRINESTIANNSASGGGGIYLTGGAQSFGGFTWISNSTISENDGRQGLGGGLYLDRGAIFRAANVTISSNRAAGGGGIASDGPNARVANLTVTDNEASIGGGLLALRRPLETGNTIFAGNTGSVAGPDVWGKVRSLGGNLVGIQGFSSGWIGSDQLGTNAAPIDPQLGPLADNGGPTLTHLPANTSPAVDAGINSNALDVDGGTLLRDQRGFERIAGVRVDVGAVEVDAQQQPSLIGGPYEIFENQDLVLDATALLNPNAQQTFSWYLVPGGFSDNPGGVLMATGSSPTVPWSTLTQLGASEPGTYGIRMVLVEDGQEEVFTTTLTILPA